MTFWERSNDLGKLEVLEVYEYYDQPVLLACRSAAETIYLVVAVEADEDAEHWLCVALSQLRFESVRSGVIDLHAAFSQPEDEIVIHVTAPRTSTSRATAKRISKAELRPDWLPSQGLRLTLPTDTLQRLSEDVQQQAKQSQRDVLGIKLDVIGTTRNEVPAGVIGRVLESVQATISAFAQNAAKAHARRATPSAELMLVAAGGGSFEVRLASAEQNESLFSVADSAIAAATRQFGELLQLADDDVAFRDRVSQLPLPIAGEYLSFLRAIEGRVNEATVEWASPVSDQHGTVVIYPQSIERAISAMVDLEHTEQTLEVVGKLIAVHTEKSTYEFLADEPVSNIERFAGKASADALASARGFTEKYRATIEEVRHVKPAGGVDVKYVLKRLQPLGG